MRLAARVDENQAEIVAALRACAIQVEIIGLPLDLLLGFQDGRTELMEIKTPEGRLTKPQVEFIARWPGKVHIVRNVAEALSSALGKAMA